jgi:hypothetical protein
MKNDLDLKSIKRQVSKFTKLLGRHSAFIGLMVVLLSYVFLVWEISRLSIAEPSSDDSALVQTQIPKVDKKAVNQIQSLEQNNTDIHSLFDSARNNPFQE